ncbi:Site-specific recombinase XerD [Dehalogenimonas formicexedens]|uniref:Site-specific recombinase XerD n=1 Tax=Dehalogenimonas formicexedens TaxID=1839801 RepID=A0A1P8F7N2_9CHLR|nr:site-specific integrase [Dehalogenimonas formicexedens]APV44477.1 Site-specific recombinase XerD [Dehalogenimonas formicexedens]
MAQRSKGAGRVIDRGTDKHGNKVWAVAAELPKTPEGKRSQVWRTVRGNRRQAEKALQSLQSEIQRKEVVKPSRGTLAVFMASWLNDNLKATASPKTFQNYSSMLSAHITPSALGTMALGDIDPNAVQAYINSKLKAGLSARTVRHHYALIHRALELATRWGMITRNPASIIDPPRFKRPEMNTLSEEQIGHVLAAVLGSMYHPIYATAIFSGARRSEYLALRWGDIDFKFASMSISRSMHYVGGKIVFTETKTAKSRRLIVLTPTLIEILTRHFEEQRALADKLERPFNQDSLVFCHADGSPVLPDSITQHWARVCKKLGFDVRLHDARHTMATIMLKQGVHPKVVAERLGHSSVSLTLDTYSHVTQSMGKVAAFQLDQAIAEAIAKAGAI